MNSITALVLKNRLFIFADDKMLVNFNDSWEELKQNVECDLQNIYNWMEKNLLSLNIISMS